MPAAPGPYASRASGGWGSPVYRRRCPPGLPVYTHDGVMALPADETGFLPVVGSQMLVVLHARRELHPLADRRTVQQTVKVDPFAAITGPRLATKRNTQASRKHLLLKCAQVFTDHLWFLLLQLSHRPNDSGLSTWVAMPSRLSIAHSRGFLCRVSALQLRPCPGGQPSRRADPTMTLSYTSSPPLSSGGASPCGESHLDSGSEWRHPERSTEGSTELCRRLAERTSASAPRQAFGVSSVERSGRSLWPGRKPESPGQFKCDGPVSPGKSTAARSYWIKSVPPVLSLPTSRTGRSVPSQPLQRLFFSDPAYAVRGRRPGRFHHPSTPVCGRRPQPTLSTGCNMKGSAKRGSQRRVGTTMPSRLPVAVRRSSSTTQR